MQGVVAQHFVALPYFRNGIHVSDTYIIEHASQKAGLSQAIFDHKFARETSPTTLYNYTKRTPLAGIASSAELRLYSSRHTSGLAPQFPSGRSMPL